MNNFFLLLFLFKKIKSKIMFLKFFFYLGFCNNCLVFQKLLKKKITFYLIIEKTRKKKENYFLSYHFFILLSHQYKYRRKKSCLHDLIT